MRWRLRAMYWGHVKEASQGVGGYAGVDELRDRVSCPGMNCVCKYIYIYIYIERSQHQRYPIKLNVLHTYYMARTTLKTGTPG